MKRLTVSDFQTIVMDYYGAHGRFDLLWRQSETDGSFDPYKILISEIMLQQTQVARVMPKFRLFLQKYPNLHILAFSPLSDILRVWSGLGYNRRAQYLWETAKTIEKGHTFPQSVDELKSLPGIGPNTAGAIVAYAFDQPVSFVETNIRSVFIYHFLNGQGQVSDKSILELVGETLDRKQPRVWYWALMDYGSYLKTVVGNVNIVSRSYSKQSVFAGSNRQVRGRVIRELLNASRNELELKALIDDPRLLSVLSSLLDERMIVDIGGIYSLSS